MVTRVRRLFDIRRSEAAPVAFSFAYVAVVVASLLLAKPVRNGLFLEVYGPYALVYVYAAVPLALLILVPMTARLAARVGQRTTIVAALWFFCANVVLFWILFRFSEIWILPAVFYVWVNCYAFIAPAQAWSLVSSLFDTRQARRLFGLVGAGASLGGIAGGLLGRWLVGPLGGTVNLLLVLAALIAATAAIVTSAVRRLPPVGAGRVHVVSRASGRAAGPRPRPSSRDVLATLASTPYLRLLAALVFVVAIATQWIGFQFSLQASQRFGGDADGLTRFFSSFNVFMGMIAFAIQLALTGPVLRRFGLAFAILVLPIALFSGSALILLAPVFSPVLLTAGADQALRFSLDKATYELLYLPLTHRQRAHVKSAIDIIVNGFADAVGAVLLGAATAGFLGFGGLGLGLRGTAAINLGFVTAWLAIAWRLRREYVVAIGESIRAHRLETERVASAGAERTTADAIGVQLRSGDTAQIVYGLELLEAQHGQPPHPALPALIDHPDAGIRRRALRLMNETGDRAAGDRTKPLLQDHDPEVRAEALIYVSRHGGTDPVTVARDLRDFPEFSIRAATAGFLAAAGPAQNLDAARLLVRAMIDDRGLDAARVRHEAARLVELRPEAFEEEIALLLSPDEVDADVLRHAARAAGALRAAHFAPLLMPHLANPDAAPDAIEALARTGDRALPAVRAAIFDRELPIEARRELPVVLARMGTPAAEDLLVEALLQGDAALRYRIIASLNKLRQDPSGGGIDREVIELVLAAEIMGHYRSYQALGALQDRHEAEEIVKGLRHAMDHELERIFRLIALIMPGEDLHSPYVALSADDRTVRANALEFLERTLDPKLASLLLPLIDPQVSIDARVQLANRLVGATIDSAESAVETLLASDDAWLRETARAASARLWRPALEPAVEPEMQPAAIAAGL